MTSTIRQGDEVVLITPDNVRLDGRAGVVGEVASWGAHVITDAAATGRYRASWDEMRLVGPSARDAGYESGECPTCGAMKLRRNGTCLCCENCGSTTGCS